MYIIFQNTNKSLKEILFHNKNYISIQFFLNYYIIKVTRLGMIDKYSSGIVSCNVEHIAKSEPFDEANHPFSYN